MHTYAVPVAVRVLYALTDTLAISPLTGGYVSILYRTGRPATGWRSRDDVHFTSAVISTSGARFRIRLRRPRADTVHDRLALQRCGEHAVRARRLDATRRVATITTQGARGPTGEAPDGRTIAKAAVLWCEQAEAGGAPCTRNWLMRAPVQILASPPIQIPASPPIQITASPPIQITGWLPYKSLGGLPYKSLGGCHPRLTLQNAARR